MAKTQTDEIKERFKQFLRYSVRIAPIVIIVGAIAWFFLLRSPGGQTKTSGTTGTTPETTTTTTLTSTKPEAKVSDNSAMAKTTDDKAKDGKLPETGPADTLAIFAITATAGTLFWEWRLRHAKQRQTPA